MLDMQNRNGVKLIFIVMLHYFYTYFRYIYKRLIQIRLIKSAKNMIQDKNQLIQCNICHCKLYNQAWEIHQIMCERNQKKKQINISKVIKEKQEKPKINTNIKQPQINTNIKQRQIKQQIIPCLQCGENIPFSQYGQHQLTCQGRQLTRCVYCDIKFPSYLIQEHLPVCESYKAVLSYQREQQQQEDNNQHEEGNYQQEQQQEQQQYNQELGHSIVRLALRQQKQPESPLTKLQINKLRTYLPPTTQNCAICYTPMRKSTACTILKCKHFYHRLCINAWLSRNPLCPLCRRHALK